MSTSSLLLSALLTFAPGPDSEPAAPERSEAPRAVGPAYAQELATRPEASRDEELSRNFFEAGVKAYGEGRFEAALEAFAAAYEAYPKPALIYSLGSCHRRLYGLTGDATQREFAVTRYIQYLEVEPHGKFSSQAQEYLTALRSIADAGMEAEVITRLLVSSAVDGAKVQVDDEAPTDAPAVLEVEPGRHRVRVSAPGFHPYEEQVEVPEGTTPQIQATLEEIDARLTVKGPRGAIVYLDGLEVGSLPMNGPLDVAPGRYELVVARPGRQSYVRELQLERDEELSVTPAMPTSSKRVLSYTFFGIGGAAALTSGAFTGLALDAQRRAKSLNAKRLDESITSAEFEDYRTWSDRRDAYRTTALVTGAAGGALLLTGAVLMLVDRPRGAGRQRDRRAARLQATPVLGLDRVGAHATVRF